jgi:uncharacterized protein (TIGR03067 family)
VDESKIPHYIDYKITSILFDGQEKNLPGAPQKGETLTGIYEVKGDILTIESEPDPTKPRPAKFKDPSIFKNK